MEIIFALMLLGATPFGAALLGDKPTRKRAVRFVDVHVKQPLKDRKRIIPAFLPDGVDALEPRQKNWKADEKLQELWQDAFDWWLLPNRDEHLRSYLESKKNHESRVALLQTQIEMCQNIYNNYLNSRAVDVHAAVDAKYKKQEYMEELYRTQAYYDSDLTKGEKIAKRMVDRYGTEIYYNNDLVRLAEKKQLPNIDFIVLTSYSSK